MKTAQNLVHSDGLLYFLVYCRTSLALLYNSVYCTITNSSGFSHSTKYRAVPLGVHLWTLFCIAGRVIAYPAFRLGKPMTIAVALHGLLGDKVYHYLGDVLQNYAVRLQPLQELRLLLVLGLCCLRQGLRLSLVFLLTRWVKLSSW